jgi:hypothetical protein
MIDQSRSQIFFGHCFYQHELSAGLGDLPHLNTVKITIVHHLHEDDMLQNAVILFLGNSRLESIKLGYTNERWSRLEDIRFKKIGTYEAVRDDNGRLVNLLVHEKGVLLVQGSRFAHREPRFSRYYRHSLPVPAEEDNMKQ